FAPEEAGADPLGERDAEIDRADGAEERVLLTEQLTRVQVDLNDLPWVRSREGDLAGAIEAAEVGDEEALPRQELALQPAEEPAFELRVHLDGLGHEHHRAGF